MKRLLNSLHTLDHLSDGTFYVLLSLFVLPWLCLMGFGLYAVYSLGLLLHFAVFLVLCTAFVVIPYIIWRRHKTRLDDQLIDKELVKAQDTWSDFDNQAWQHLTPQIDKYLADNNDWAELKTHSLALIEQTAEHYHPQRTRNTLAFSVPELLLMIEVVSRRYRTLVKAHFPFVEQLHLSTLQMGYEHKDKVHLAKKGWNVYRLFRSTTPVGLLAELRGQLIGQLFGNVSEKLQYKLKYTLLQEVLRVAIDLYSGRFKLDDSELGTSQTSHTDEQLTPLPIEPLRICLVGQISAGKSSLVNALSDQMQAEVSQLPSTSQQAVYQCQLEGIDMIKLIDMPGLDGQDKTLNKVLSQITQSDLVLWVLKANQPARGLDTALKQLIDNYYQLPENRAKKRPYIVGVLNHVDRLPPLAEWLPPYDLANDQIAKVKTINEALAYNQELLALDNILPLAISSTQAWFNVDTLKTLIIDTFNQGVQVQLNRRRVENDEKIDTSEHAKRLYRLGHSLFKQLTKKD